MNRKNFLKTVLGVLTVPFVSVKTEEPKTTDMLKLSHLYDGAYAGPNDLWTPEEITAAGFVFVDSRCLTHRFNDPNNPIMKYVDRSNDPNLLHVIMKCRKFCEAYYIKTYDLDKGRVRGIESVADYLNKKDIFKPMIVEWMKKMEYHYVYKVVLEDSPASWVGKFGDSDMIFHRHAVNVIGSRLPKRV